MNDFRILKPAILNAFGAALYIYVVATFMHNAEHVIGPTQETLGVVLFLLLVVVSVASMGILIFGRPILWYLDGRKREAVILVISTVLVLVLIGILVSVVLILKNG